MMSYWERLHAINAVQVTELSQKIELQRLRLAVSRLLVKFLASDSLGRWPSLWPNGTAADRPIAVQLHRLPATSASGTKGASSANPKASA